MTSLVRAWDQFYTNTEHIVRAGYVEHLITNQHKTLQQAVMDINNTTLTKNQIIALETIVESAYKIGKQASK